MAEACGRLLPPPSKYPKLSAACLRTANLPAARLPDGRRPGATASGIKVSSGGREGILFDHLAGDGEQRRRHLDAERPGRCGSEQTGIWKRFQMPAKNVCDCRRAVRAAVPSFI
jgi:hypothetical protein